MRRYEGDFSFFAGAPMLTMPDKSVVDFRDLWRDVVKPGGWDAKPMVITVSSAPDHAARLAALRVVLEAARIHAFQLESEGNDGRLSAPILAAISLVRKQEGIE